MDWEHSDDVNLQICTQWTASYTYEALWVRFACPNVTLPGVSAFFRDRADERRNDARVLAEYQLKRGGTVVLASLEVPSEVPIDLADPLTAFEMALELEVAVNRSHEHLSQSDDPHLAHFTQTHFRSRSVDTIAALKGLVARLRRIGDNGAGIEAFDLSLVQKNILL